MRHSHCCDKFDLTHKLVAQVVAISAPSKGLGIKKRVSGDQKRIKTA